MLLYIIIHSALSFASFSFPLGQRNSSFSYEILSSHPVLTRSLLFFFPPRKSNGPFVTWFLLDFWHFLAYFSLLNIIFKNKNKNLPSTQATHFGNHPTSGLSFITRLLEKYLTFFVFVFCLSISHQHCTSKAQNIGTEQPSCPRLCDRNRSEDLMVLLRCL